MAAANGIRDTIGSRDPTLMDIVMYPGMDPGVSTDPDAVRAVLYPGKAKGWENAIPGGP